MTGIISIIVAAFLGGMFLMWRFSEVRVLKKEILELKKPKPIETQIKALQEITTLEARYMSVVSGENAASFLLDLVKIPGTKREFLMTLSAIAVWGCDLSKAKKLITNSGNVKIIVPHCNITRIYDDPQSRKVYYQKSGIFTSIKINEVNEAIRKTLDKIRDEIIKDGAQQKLADKNLKLILETIVKAANTGDNDVAIIFEDEDESNNKQNIIEVLLDNISYININNSADFTETGNSQDTLPAEKTAEKKTKAKITEDKIAYINVNDSADFTETGNSQDTLPAEKTAEKKTKVKVTEDKIAYINVNDSADFTETGNSQDTLPAEKTAEKKTKAKITEDKIAYINVNDSADFTKTGNSQDTLLAEEPVENKTKVKVTEDKENQNGMAFLTLTD